MQSKFLNLFILKRFFVILLFFPLLLTAQTEEVTWNYPVHPGTEEWKQLNSFSERLDAFNIPDSILAEITTENLVKTCLKYPWWILITSRDNNQTGYDYLKSVFNGFQELEKRKDAGKELLKIYKQLNPGKRLELKTLVEKGRFSYQLVLIETILSQPDILKNLSAQDLSQLLGVAISIFRDKSNPTNNYSLYSLSSTGLLQGRILEKYENGNFFKIKEEFPRLEEFIIGGITDNRKMLIRIYNESKNYYNNL
jgi:hypothetical protein